MRIAVWAKETPHQTRGYIQEGCALLGRYADVELILDLPGQQGDAQARFSALCPELDALVVGPWYHPPVPADDWGRAAKLRVVAGTFDNRFAWLDFAALSKRGVALVDTSRSMTPTVAEFALAMTLNLLRDVPAALELVRRGEWKPHACAERGFVSGDLTGRRVGLAGFGSINRRYAELLAPFHCKVTCCDPFVSPPILAQYGVNSCATLIDLAQCSEIFVVGIPPTPQTQNIISREVIYALPQGALFVLVTRMAVVDQEALWQRVFDNELYAAVDVFAPEPPPTDAWFRAHPNVLATPHLAGDTDYCHRRCFTDACADTVALLTGQPPRFQATAWDNALYQGSLKSTTA